MYVREKPPSWPDIEVYFVGGTLINEYNPMISLGPELNQGPAGMPPSGPRCSTGVDNF